MEKIVFVLHEEVIDVFHNKFYIPTIYFFIPSSSCTESWFNGIWEDYKSFFKSTEENRN